MLTPNPSTQISYSSPRQIVAFSQTSGTVLYTVPAGKKFQGYVYGASANAYINITPSGGSQIGIYVPNVSVSYASTTPQLLTFVAGTIITCASSNAVNMIGVETDA